MCQLNLEFRGRVNRNKTKPPPWVGVSFRATIPNSTNPYCERNLVSRAQRYLTCQPSAWERPTRAIACLQRRARQRPLPMGSVGITNVIHTVEMGHLVMLWMKQMPVRVKKEGDLLKRILINNSEDEIINKFQDITNSITF